MRVPKKPLPYLERARGDAAKKKIKVYFITAFDKEKGEKAYYYAIASASLHDTMLKSLQAGDIPYFAVIVEKGYGEPTAEVKQKISDYYGFDHDLVATQEQMMPVRTTSE